MICTDTLCLVKYVPWYFKCSIKVNKQARTELLEKLLKCSFGVIFCVIFTSTSVLMNFFEAKKLVKLQSRCTKLCKNNKNEVLRVLTSFTILGDEIAKDMKRYRIG